MRRETNNSWVFECSLFVRANGVCVGEGGGEVGLGGGGGRGMKAGINVDCVMVDWLLLIDVCLQESEIQQHYQPASGHVHRNNSLDAFVRTNRTLPNIFKSFCTTSFNQNGWSNSTFLDSCRITKSEHSRVAHWTFWQTWKSCKWRPTTFNNTSAEIRTSIHSFLKLSFFRRLWIV